MEDLEERLARWQRAGLITGSQGDAIRSYERSRPRLSARPGQYPYEAPLAPRQRPLPRPGPGREPPPAPWSGREMQRPPAPQQQPRVFQPVGPERAEPLVGFLPEVPDGRVVGLLMAVLAVVGAIAGIFAVTVDLLIAPTHNLRGDLEDLLHLGASILGVVGGARMASGVPSGRLLVLASLGINVVATLVLSHTRTQIGTVFELLLWIALALVVSATRFGRSAPSSQG